MVEPACVVLVHGLWWGRPSMLLLARRLHQAGFTTAAFGYSSVFTDPALNAARLAGFARAQPARALHFVGHSLGGLLILNMLAGLDARLPPGRIVLLGTPLNGASVAHRMADWPGLDRLLGASRAVLCDGCAALPDDRATLMVAGTSPVGLGRLLGHLEPPHDGTVRVAETRHPGLAAHLTLPVSHTGLLASHRVADAVRAFLLDRTKVLS